MHHPKNPVLEFHGWDETVPQGSAHLVSLNFFQWGYFFGFITFFFSPTTPDPKFFLEPPTYTSNLLTPPPPTPPLLHSLHCQQVEHLGLGAWSFRSFRNESSISYFKVSTSQFSFVPFASPSFLLPPHCTKTDKALVVFVLVLVPPQRHQAKLIVSFFLF